MTATHAIRHWGDGVFSVDSGYLRPGFDAIHLLVESDRAAIIDSGTRHSAPGVLAALDALGIERDHVDWVILTHVHLDHAGGAGALLQSLPAARLTVHPRGARHMSDPGRLWAGTVEVYGREAAESMYGEVVPVAADRIVQTGDGARIELAGRALEFLDTPGHARHHVVIRDGFTGHLFCGDMFGISYREFDVAGRAFAFPSSTPVQFDPDQMLRSLQRMLALRPEAVYLTHYGQVRDVPRLGALLQRLTQRYAELALDAQRTLGAGSAEADATAAVASALQARIEHGMAALLTGELRAHGCTMDDARMAQLLQMDVRLNSAGLIDWLRSRADAA